MGVRVPHWAPKFICLWPSLVRRLVWVQKIGSSNLSRQTNKGKTLVSVRLNAVCSRTWQGDDTGAIKAGAACWQRTTFASLAHPVEQLFSKQ